MSEFAERSPRGLSPSLSSGSTSPRNPQTEGYEQNRMEVAALHEALQKKTFTRWMNSHLEKANQSVNDIYVDLGTGEKLALLLTLLTDEPIKLPEKGKMRFHKVNNTNSVLDFIKSKKIKLVGIGAEDVIDGKRNLILGLIWTIILNFQISMIVTEPGIDPKKEIIDWAKRTTAGRYDLNISDLTTCWTDGLAFAAIIHRHRPELINITKLDKNKPIENMTYAFKVAQDELNVMSLLEPEDLAKGIFDEKCTMTYLSMLKQALPNLPAGSSWSEKDQLRHRFDELQRWVEERKIVLAKQEMPDTSEDCNRELNVVNRISKDCKSKENEVVSIQKFEEKIEMMASAESDAASNLDFDGLKEQIINIEGLSTERSESLSKHQKLLEQTEELLMKAKSKLLKIEADLQALSTEAENLRKEFSLSCDSKKLEKLEKRKEAADKKAENCGTALKEIETLLATLPDIECKAVYPVKDLYNVECEHLNQIYQSLANIQPNLPDIDNLIEWVNSKTEAIASSNFPSELSEVRQEISEHAKLHQEIEKFSQQIVSCQQVSQALQEDHAESFIQKCQILETRYETLKSLSEKRQEDLRLLEELLNSAKDLHSEMEVLEVREKIRKWNPQPKPQTLQTELKALDKSIAELDPKVSKFAKQASALAEHPAFASVIQVELGLVLSRQEWIQRLRQALVTHTQDYNSYKEFHIKLDEFESEVSKAESTLAQYAAELDAYSTDCIEILNPILTRCEQEFESRLSELEVLAVRAPPYHLRDNPDCADKKLNGYAIVRGLETNGVDAGSEMTIASMETDENWEVELANGDTTMLPAAIIQLSPDNDLNTLERLNRLKERHSNLRTSLSIKLGLAESVGDLMQQVEVSAQSVISWDKTSLIGENKTTNTDCYMDFTRKSEELLSKLPPDGPMKEQVVEKIRRARSHWSSLNDEAVSEELKERLQDLEAWCRYWQQNLDEQAPLGITVERVMEQMKWQQHLEDQFPERFRELSVALEEVSKYPQFQSLAGSVETQLNSLKASNDEWASALNTLKGGFDKISEAWEWLLQLEEYLLKLSDKAMTADTQGQENLEELRQSVLDLINNKIPQHEPSLKTTLAVLAEISEQLVQAGGSQAITMGAQALRHRWDLMLTEATRLDQGLGGLTKLVALLPRLATELGEWIDERNDDIGNREKVPLEINELRKLAKTEDRFHKSILMKTPDFEEYSKSAQTHDQIILTITQSHQSYARTLSNARPALSYTTKADGNATHCFQEDADQLLSQWDNLVLLSEKSLEYKQSTLAELESVMKLFTPLNALLVEGEQILGEKLRAPELEIWLQKAESFITQKSSYEPAVGTFVEECSSLISTSDSSLVETAPLAQLLADFKSRWESLKLAIQEKQKDCKDQIEKLQDEKGQIDTICKDLQSHSTAVSRMEVILQGISLPGASQSILDQQKIVLEKSDAELKEEERKVTELMHKLGDVSTNINTEIDQTDMAAHVAELETKLAELKQSFREFSIEILEQDVVVQPFEPQLNSLVALHQEARAQFDARQAPALDDRAIQQGIEANRLLLEKLANNALVLEQTLQTGKSLLNKASEDKLNELSVSEYILDPQISESYSVLKEKLASLELGWNELGEEMHQTEQSLGEMAELAQEGYNEVDTLFKRINGLKNELAKKGPPGAVPSIVEEQLADMQKFQALIAEIDECIGQLKDKLKINSSSPGELAEQLARMEHEQTSLKHLSNEYQGRLNEGLALANKYKDAHQDLVAWLQENLDTFAQWKLIGVEIQVLDIQQKSLRSFKDILLSRVEEKQTQEGISQLCSAEQRPSHETTTGQYTQLCELWSSLEVKIETRQTNLDKMESLAKTFDEQVQSASVQLDDIGTDIFNLQPKIPTEIELILAEIEHVKSLQTRLIGTEQEMQQLSDTAKQITTLASDPQFTDQIQSVTGENERLHNEKETSCTVVAKRLEQLNNALKLAQEIKSEEESISEWVSSSSKHLEKDYVTRGVSEACAAELEKLNSFHETVEGTQSRVRGLEQLGRELTKDASEKDKAKIEKSISSLKNKVEAVVNKEENVMANLQDALMEAESFESMCQDMTSFIEQASAKLKDISESFKDVRPEDLEGLLENIKELLVEVVSKQIDMEKISEKGMDMSSKCPQDDDKLLTCVANLQQQYDDLQEKAEGMQREMDEAFLKAGELRKTTGNLINWLKEANAEMDNSPPLIAEVEAIEHALSKHRARATQLATKASTIESVLKALPSMSMTAEANELGTLVKVVKEKVAARNEKILQAQKCFKQFALRETRLRESIDAYMDQLDESENCYGIVTVVEEISVQHEALISDIPGMEQMLDDMKEISLTNRSENLIDDPTILEAQLEEIFQLWEVFMTRATQQSEEIHKASIIAQRQASLYTNLYNWIEPTFTELSKPVELTPNNLEVYNKKVTDMESGLEQHRPQYEELAQLYEMIEARAHPTGLDELIDMKEGVKKNWAEIEKLIQGRRKELEAATKGIEEIMKKLMEIAEWTESATAEMERRCDNPIPSSNEDLPLIEEMMVQHEEFMKDLGTWHSELEPVNRVVKALQKTEKGKEMEEQRKKVNKQMQVLWVHAAERQRLLKEAKDRIVDRVIYASFDYQNWLDQFKSHMTKQKMREADIFRKADVINHTYLSKEDFISSLKNTGFNCKIQELELVAVKFQDSNNLVNVDQFMKSFRPKLKNDPRPEKVVINEHVMREVSKCSCDNKFRVDKKETPGGLMYQFGNNKVWRLVRILSNSVMVRVGGGWEELDKFLIKQDPCRSDRDFSKHLHGKINSDIYNFEDKNKMVHIQREYQSKLDPKTKMVEDSRKNVNISFHDPSIEETPLKDSPSVVKKGQSQASPSLKKKLDTGISGAAPPSRMTPPTSISTSRIPTGLRDSSQLPRTSPRDSSSLHRASPGSGTQGASGTERGSKPVSRNSSFKDGRGSGTPNKTRQSKTNETK